MRDSRAQKHTMGRDRRVCTTVIQKSWRLHGVHFSQRLPFVDEAPECIIRECDFKTFAAAESE